MATFKFEIVAGGTTYTKTKNISGPDLIRLIAAYRLRYPEPALTDAEIADYFFEDLFRSVRLQVKSIEQQSLAEIAIT